MHIRSFSDGATKFSHFDFGERIVNFGGARTN
jgi:hypothetical protein